MEEEGDDLDFIGEVPLNKKLTLFVIDGSDRMLEGGSNCAFRNALKVVYHQMLKICCSGSLNHMMGLIITNTENSKNRFGQKFSYEYIELSVPSKEEITSLKNLVESDNLESDFKSIFGGHAVVNLANLMWSCKKIMATSATSSRHHIIMYITNNPNPFTSDPKAYSRLQTILTDFCKPSYMDKNGIRRVNKTPGEFHVLMLADEISDEDREKWTNISNSFFMGDVEDLDLHAYKKSYTQRAFSTVAMEIGPNIKLGISVFTLAKETTLPKKVYLDADTEAPLIAQRKYVEKAPSTSQKDESSTSSEFMEQDVKDLPKTIHKVLKIGGQVVSDDQISDLANFDDKGIVLLGFKPIEEIDVFGEHIAVSQFIQPNENTYAGSTQAFRALHTKCLERKVAMICRFQSRINQKIRLTALIPESKQCDSDEQEDITSDYRSDGFYVVYLPFAEDFKDIEDKITCPFGEWPTPNAEDVNITRKFIRNLNKPYSPEMFYNPRIKSFNSMLIQAAVGDEVEREDTIRPFFETRTAEFVNKLTTPFIEYFELHENSIPEQVGTKRSATSDASGKKKPKFDEDVDVETLIRNDQLQDLTVASLKKIIVDNGIGKYKATDKKVTLIELIKSHYK